MERSIVVWYTGVVQPLVMLRCSLDKKWFLKHCNESSSPVISLLGIQKQKQTQRELSRNFSLEKGKKKPKKNRDLLKCDIIYNVPINVHILSVLVISRSDNSKGPISLLNRSVQTKLICLDITDYWQNIARLPNFNLTRSVWCCKYNDNIIDNFDKVDIICQ